MTIPTPSQLATQARRSSTRWSRSRARGSSIPSARTACGTPPARCCATARRPPRATPPPRSNFPDEPAIIDELGTLSFREVDERTNALAHALGGGRDRGRRRRRDHVPQPPRLDRRRPGLLASSAPTRCSSTRRSPARSSTDVAKREKPKAVVYDQEFAEVLKDASARRKRYVAWSEGKTKDPTLEDADRARRHVVARAPPSEQGRAIILTSGTTGTPKGASRSMPKSIDPIAALLSVIPLRAREKTMIAAPLFHAWGFAQWALGISLATTVVLKRKFDEEATLVADRPARVQRARRRAGDDPAHPRARRRGARPLRPLEGPRRAGLAAPRCRARSRTAGWTTSARTSTTSTARPRSRGRRSPRRATCARRPAPSASRRAAAS